MSRKTIYSSFNMSGEMSVKQRRRMHITIPAIEYNEDYWAEECYKMCDKRFLRSVAAMKSELPIVQYLNYMKSRFTCISLMKKCYLRLKQIDYNYANRIYKLKPLMTFDDNTYLRIVTGFENEVFCVDMLENCCLVNGVPGKNARLDLDSSNRSGSKEPVLRVYGYDNVYALTCRSGLYIYKRNFVENTYSRIHYIDIQEYVTKSIGQARLAKSNVSLRFCNEFCVGLIETSRNEKFLNVFNLKTGKEVRLQNISSQFPRNTFSTAMSLPQFTNIANVIVLNVQCKEEENEKVKGLILMWDITQLVTEIRHLLSPPTNNSCLFIDRHTFITYTFTGKVTLSVYDTTTSKLRVSKDMLIAKLNYSSVQVFGDRIGFVGDKMTLCILNKDTLDTLAYLHNDGQGHNSFVILPCNLYAYYDNGVAMRRFGETGKSWIRCRYDDITIVKSHCNLKLYVLQREVDLKKQNITQDLEEECFLTTISTFPLL